jgi:hypothetical protein
MFRHGEGAPDLVKEFPSRRARQTDIRHGARSANDLDGRIRAYRAQGAASGARHGWKALAPRSQESA